MSRPDRQRIEAVFQAALDVPEDQREALLESRCGGDEALRREVDTLLQHYESAAASPAVNEALFRDFRKIPESAVEEVEGRRVGPYRLIRVIGEGGMGRVFLAEHQDLPRRVAIKLAREPLASPERTRRFLFEQWVLAGLEHPAIGRLYDAGISEDGSPYFAMEYVEGDPLDVYCNRRRLPVEARIRLFLQVLEAVEHSHTHLVVHRDLKPSNILVTRDGIPKLLDFGIAKLLTEDGESGLTRTGLMAFSPAYAAPEQVSGEPATTATDVYQAGAVLYELLCGSPPLDTSGKNLSEIGRIVREEEPPYASTRVSPHAAGERGAGPDRLRRKLRGDLDHVMARALEKDPGRRYASVSALAADLRRHLNHLPLEVRPPGPAERARKFLVRHKAGSAVAAALVIYAATATFGLVRIGAERDRARREAVTATRVSNFLVEVFSAADPGDTLRLSPGELVDRGAERAERDLAEEPEILASMQEVLGRVYYYLGRSGRAESLLRRSLETRQRLFGDRSLEVGDTKHYLAQVLWATGDLAGADSLVREALDVRRRSYGETSDEAWEGLSDLATIEQASGNLDEARRILEDLVDQVRAMHPEGYVWLGQWLNNLANIYLDLGLRDEAEAMMREALASDRQALPEPHPSVALRLNNLATLAAHAGRYQESLALAREALAQYRELYPEPHPDPPYALAALGNAARELGDMRLADSAHVAALEMREAIYPPGDYGRIVTYRAYGEHLVKTGRPAKAIPYLERWRDIAAEIHGREHYAYGLAVWTLGLAHEELGKAERAEKEFRLGLAVHRSVLGDEHPRVVAETEHLGGFLEKQGKPGEAAALQDPSGG